MLAGRAALLALLAVPALGQEATPTPDANPPPKRVIEEIIVTAQKIEENVQEVPISMSVIDEELLRQTGVTALDEASRIVPNFSVDAGSFGTSARVRGFETGIINKGFEQAVGLLIDGVVYGRKQYFESALFDVDRLEVLRGPQGTLFGKNNSAGLVSIVTKNPSDDYSGHLDLQYGELDRRRVEAGIGGPIIRDFLNVRLAGLIDERDGYVENTTAAFVPEVAERFGENNRKGLRAKLGLPNVFGANVVLSYDKFRIDEPTNLPVEIFGGTEAAQELLRQYDPNVDFVAGNFVASQDHRAISFRDFDTFVANASYDWAGWALDGLFGYGTLEVFDEADGDFTPAPAVFAIESDDNFQTTVETRLTSPLLGGLFGMEVPKLLGAVLTGTEFTAGFFFQRRLIRDSTFKVGADPVVLVALAGASMSPIGLPPLPPLGPAEPGELNETTTGFYSQTANTFAGFGQLRWHLGERLTLLTGLRLSNEQKSADWVRVLEPATAVLLRAAFEPFTAKRSRSELEFSPKVNLTYKVTDSINAYATWARGFRPGGFNEFAGTPDRLEFEQEKATDWEVGTKMDLLDGAARFNLGLFRTTLKNFQVLTDQPGGFLVLIAQNAGGALSQGVEAELTWLATSWLTFFGSLGFDDTEFRDFPQGGCVDDTEDPDGDGDPRCDHSGETLPRAPKWTISGTPSIQVPFTQVPFVKAVWPAAWSALSLTSHFTVEYEDTQYLREFLDKRLRQGSFFRFHGSIGLADLGRGWSLRLVAENLTDEAIAVGAAEVPFVGPPLSKAYAPPRLLFGELRWAF